jgi:Cu(I)/Ag(I) efflux system membrane fusion protein
MARTWPKWWGWAAAAVALLALGGAVWYAQARGWLTPVFHWAQHLAPRGDGGEGQGGMSMNMPGMDQGSMSPGQPGGTSAVPGHAGVTVPGEVQQRIGVTVGRVEDGPLRMTVRTVGIVRPNETKVAHVHLRTEGWIDKLYVDYTGQQVKKGDRLLAIYSPQFATTQEEYINARQSGQNSVARLARRRLELWDVSVEEIDELDRIGKPRDDLTLRSPLTGTVLTKNAFQGQYVTPQADLYVVADLSTVWVQAKVYEYELPHVEIGQPATVTVPALPDREFTGKVVFVQQTVEEKTRTVEVRVELPNPGGVLKPDMFAHITIQHTMGKGLLVPDAAVVRTGERDIAYRDEGDGRFVPVAVKVGPLKFGDRFQVLEGLKAGDKVSTSANFLIDSESRLRVAGGMASMPGMDMGNMPGMDKGGMKGKPGTPEGGEGKDHSRGGMEGEDHSQTKH